MRIGTGMAGMEAVRDRKGPEERGGRFRTGSYSEAMSFENSMWMISGSRVQELEEKDGREENGVPKEKAEAEKIYQAAVSGKPNPVENLREASKVPYGYLAKDGVIEYNGVCFVCDEKTNSICLGDMTDTKNVLTITLGRRTSEGKPQQRGTFVQGRRHVFSRGFKSDYARHCPGCEDNVRTEGNRGCGRGNRQSAGK